MKYNYNCIKENIKIYNQAKARFPLITQYEKGEVLSSSLRAIGLEKFAEFYDFSKNQNLICTINWRELKKILVENTTNLRFKSYLQNRTQNQFKKLLTEDGQTFDRLLNGRWIKKPGGRSWGKRATERAEGLTNLIPLINYIISNDIDTFEGSYSTTYKPFHSQDFYINHIKWYTNVELNINDLPVREIEITTNLLNSLVNFISESDIDFRKLNSVLITETISTKIKNLMKIPKQTQIKSLVDFANYNRQFLTKDKLYQVEDSTFNSGFLRVMIIDDSGHRNWYDYKKFEDLSIQRDLLLKQLGI